MEHAMPKIHSSTTVPIEDPKTQDMEWRLTSMFHLGDGIHVSTIDSNGEPHIDIRQWALQANGTWTPTMAGVNITLPCWKKLVGDSEQLMSVTERL